MRLRARHIAIALVVLVTGFVLVVTTMRPPTPEDSDSAEGAALPPIGIGSGEPAVLAVETAELDLGVIPNNAEGHGKVRVSNHGKEPLKITEVRSSCACTRGAFPPKALPILPGADAYLEVTVDPKRIYGFESHKILTLFSNDPVRPSVDVTVIARVDPEFVVDPANFDFGILKKGEAAERELRLRTLADTPVKITGISTTQPGSEEAGSPNIAVEYAALPETEWKSPGKPEYMIRAKLDPSMPPGAFDVPVFISIDVPRFPFHRLKATGSIEAPYCIEMPDKLSFVVVRPDNNIVRVKIRSEVASVFESAAAETPSLTVNGEPVGGGFDVLLKAATGLSAGRHNDRVRVKFSVGGKVFEESFNVRVFAP